jgi:hypothetical protein
MRPILLLALSFFMIHAFSTAQRTGERFRHFLGFTLDENTLSQVQERFGTSKLVESGNAGEYLALVTYCIPSRSTIVTFEADELGGPSHFIQGFGLRAYDPAEGTRTDLPTLAIPASDSLSIAGLRLGMSPQEFVNSLGQPIRWRGDTGYFSISGKDSASNSDRKPYVLDIHLSVMGVFVSRQLRTLSVWITRTY